jgi:tetratricopeptide (TPR) repeat protein
MGDVHATLARTLLVGADDDAFCAREVMFHLLRSGQPALAAEYFGKQDLQGAGLTEAVGRIAEHLLDVSNEHRVDEVLAMLRTPTGDATRWNVAHRLVFEVMRTLQGEATLELRRHLVAGASEVLTQAFASSNLALQGHALLEATRLRAVIERDAKQRALANDFARRALQLAQQLVVLEPAEPEWKHDAAIAHAELGEILAEHQPAEALQHHQRALALVDELIQHHPRETRYQATRAGITTQAGNQLAKFKRLDHARMAYEEALALLVQLRAWRPSYAGEEAIVLEKLGAIAVEEGEFALARKRLTAAIERLDEWLHDAPRDALRKHQRARVSILLARIERRVGTPRDVTLELYSRALLDLHELVAWDGANIDIRRDAKACELELAALT